MQAYISVYQGVFQVCFIVSSRGQSHEITCFLTGVLAAWNLVTHLMHLKDYWRTWLRGLKLFMFIGAFFMIVTAAGFIAYLVLGITKSESE